MTLWQPRQRLAPVVEPGPDEHPAIDVTDVEVIDPEATALVGPAGTAALPDEADPEPAAALLPRVRSGFRTWRHGRPFWAGVWTLVGGAIIAYVPATAFRFVFATSSIAVGVTVGVIIAVLGLVLWLQPPLRIPVGIVISLLSLLSFVTSDFGGFFLGMLCGLVGGALATAWAPVEQPVAVAVPETAVAPRHATGWVRHVPLPHRRVAADRGRA